MVDWLRDTLSKTNSLELEVHTLPVFILIEFNL